MAARIYDPRRAAIYERVGIPTVGHRAVGHRAHPLHRILPDRAVSDWVDPSAKVILVERPNPTTWAGHKVLELELAGTARLVSLTRLGVAAIPTADLISQDGDVIHIAVAGDHLEDFERHLLEGPTAGGSH